MFFTPAAVVCAISLLSSAHALALNNRQSDCGFVCPAVDNNGNGPSVLTEIDDASFSCTFAGAFGNACTYDSVSCATLSIPSRLLTFLPQTSGALVGDNADSSCPQQATSQCSTRRRRDDDDDDDDHKTDDWKPTPSWTPDPYPSWSKPPTSTTWSKPTKSWSKPSRSWSKPGPTPSPWKPQPPKKQPCPYTCPQKNLIGGVLSDEAIRGQNLFCRYPSKSCKQCGFCKYSTVSLHPRIRSDDHFLTFNTRKPVFWSRTMTMAIAPRRPHSLSPGTAATIKVVGRIEHF